MTSPGCAVPGVFVPTKEDELEDVADDPSDAVEDDAPEAIELELELVSELDAFETEDEPWLVVAELIPAELLPALDVSVGEPAVRDAQEDPAKGSAANAMRVRLRT